MANLVSFSYKSKFFNNIILGGINPETPSVGELGYFPSDSKGRLKYGNDSGAWTILATMGDIPVVHNMPAGGTKGQSLVKRSNTDYDVEWKTVETGTGNVPTGGTTNQVLAKNSDTDYDLKWVDQTGGGSTMHAMCAIIDSSCFPGDVSVFTRETRAIPYLLVSNAENPATFTIQCWKGTKGAATLIATDITLIEDAERGTTSLNVHCDEDTNENVKINLFWSATGTTNNISVNGVTYDPNISVTVRARAQEQENPDLVDNP